MLQKPILKRRFLRNFVVCFVAMVACLLSHVHAQTITADGNYNPTYPGDMPWIVGDGLIVGENGTGSMSIIDGAEVESELGTIGVQANGIGNVLVSGSESKWLNDGNLIVGNFGTATLTVNDGALVTGFNGLIGYVTGSDGELIVDGANSQVELEANTLIGYRSQGKLTIRNQGYVYSPSPSAIGYFEAGDGEVLVQGFESAWDIDDLLYVGRYGFGRLSVANARVTNEIGYVGSEPGGVGTVFVGGNQSTWDCSHLYIGGSSSVSGGTGRVTARDFGTVNVENDLIVWENGTLVLSRGEFHAKTLELVAGTLDFKIRESDSYVSTVIETATLNGTITVDFEDYQPAPGETFTLIDAGTIEGTPVFEFLNLGDDVCIDTSNFMNEGTISVTNYVSLVSSFDAGIGGINGVAFDSSTNRIYAHAEFGETIDIFDTSGTIVGSIVDPGANGYSSDYFFSSSPTTIAGVDVPANSLLIIEDHSEARDLMAADPVTGVVLASQSLDFINGEVVGGTYCSSTGTFFACDYVTDEVYEFSGNGTLINTFSVGGGFDVYYGDIEYNEADGNLYLVSSTQSIIRVFNPAGNFVHDIVLTGITSLSMSGISFDQSNGNAWICSTTGFIHQVSFGKYIAAASTLNVTRGSLASGEVGELGTSNNSDLSIRRSNTDIQSRTEFELESLCPFSTLSEMKLKIEGSVFARTEVIQTIELFDFNATEWVVVDTRDAARFIDRVDEVVVAGGLMRFVEPTTGVMRSRVRFQSTNPRQRFTSNTDQFIWIMCD